VSPDLDERDPTGRFVRGLTIGALLGAIIAGSSIWSRARARRAPADVTTREPGRAGASGTPDAPNVDEAVATDRPEG